MNSKGDQFLPALLSLREIASWHEIPELTENPKIRATIPVLQRGLVWSPAQVELLWDSILRGFPIGSLVLSARIRNQEKKADTEKRGITHHLLDGQQRCDAIALGFKDPFGNVEALQTKTESILWLDLDPEKDHWSTREFVIRLTTTCHPWGYTRGDATGSLSAESIRKSLAGIGLDPAKDGYQRPKPVDLWPQAATVPIPLAWLLLDRDGENLWVKVRDRMDTTTSKPWYHPLREFLDCKEKEEQRTKICSAIQRTRDIRIVALYAPDDLLLPSRQEVATGENREHISNIEHLFQRLNRQGTHLDGEELAYSMIKAYWPELAEHIDGIANKKLPATRLISLGIRAALSTEDQQRLPNGMGVSEIRSMAQKNDEKMAKVYCYIKNELAKNCAKIESWLLFHEDYNASGLLPVHIANIANDSPDLYLLLLILAAKSPRNWEANLNWHKHLQALSTIVHWFGRNKANICNLIFRKCVGEVTIANIREALAEAVEQGDLRPVHSPAYLETFDLQNWKWDTLICGSEEEKRALWDKWGEFLWFRGQREMLLYAQREFVHRRFNYDPSRKDFWKGHNRPWDFDHILASAFLYRAKTGDFKRACDQWVGTIGNLRAWPFEDNRSDQAESADKKIQSGASELKRINSFLELDEIDGFAGGRDVKAKEEAALKFITACRKRLLRIYRTWYESVGVSDLYQLANSMDGISDKKS